MKRFFLLVLLAASTCSAVFTPNAQAQTIISIDAADKKHTIDARIYGVNYATTEQLKLLNTPLHRMGGNNTSRYNWQLNADNRGHDWFFQSIGDEKSAEGARGDDFVRDSKAGGAAPMLTVPIIDWVAKVGAGREKLASFSVQKYGAQQKTDQWMPDAGNGYLPDGKPLGGNDPSDANTRNSVAMQTAWVKHLVGKWGLSQNGGVGYYILDNEPALWNSTHRDVQPTGVKLSELRDKTIAFSRAIKAIDPSAKIVAPEEWGWTGYFHSGFDAQIGPSVGWDASKMPDRAAHGGGDFIPTFLSGLKAHDEKNKTRTLDVFTLHFYPQGGEFSDDVSPPMQERRNRSTRALWDAGYQDETWIADKVRLVSRMKEWAKSYFPDVEIGLTEYNWGGEKHINGATTQADILGIFGRENLHLAARWTTPPTDSPTFKAMQLFRNADNQNNGFGEISLACAAPDADKVSAFASLRQKDGALTIMLINKQLGQNAPLGLNVSNFKAATNAQMWQLTSTNRIEKLADVAASAKMKLELPAQSITLLVLPKA